MTAYKVLQYFQDKDTGIYYNVGETYPTTAFTARLAELLGTEHPNHTGAIIEEVADVEPTTPSETMPTVAPTEPSAPTASTPSATEPTTPSVDKPTDRNTKAEIIAYLTAQGIAFDANAVKSDLLLLVK